jgi:microcompartment protein CcmL/EutN
VAASGVEFLPHFADRPALGILELGSIARGVQVADSVIKKAPSTLLMSRPVSGGKHLVIFRGDVASVEESMAAGRAMAAERLVDELELPYAHAQIWPLLKPAIEGVVRESRWEPDEAIELEAVAIVETTTVAAAVHAADASAKAAQISLRDMRLAVGIEGKAFYTMSGELYDIEASVLAAREVAGDRLLELEVIPAPAGDIRGRLIF